MTSMRAPTQQQRQASTIALQSAASSRGQDYLANPSAVLQRGVNDNDSYSTSQISFYNGVPSEDANGGGYSGLTQPAFSSQTYVDGKVYSDEELINIVMECVSDGEKLAAAAISSAPYTNPSLPVTVDVEMRTHARVPYHAIPRHANNPENTTVLPRNPTAESGISIPRQRNVLDGQPPSYEATMQRHSARAKHAKQQDKTENKGKRSRKGDGNKGSKRLKTQQQPALNGHPLGTNGIIQGNIAYRNYAGDTTSGLQCRNLLRLPSSSPSSIPTQHGPLPWTPIGSSQTSDLPHGRRYAQQNSPALLGHRSLQLQEPIVPLPFQIRVPAQVFTPSPTRNTPLAPLQISQFTPSEFMQSTPHPTQFPSSHHSPGLSLQFHPQWM